MKVTKKIALATAAALAIVGVSTVAHATPLAVTVAGVANTTTSAAPKTVAVPVSNVIDSSNTVALAATADTGTVVNYVASGVKLVSALNTTLAPVSSTSGVSSLSVTSQGTAVTVYAYTTSTTVGSVTITNGAYSTIVYIQGTAGVAANVAVSVPASAAVNTAPTISVSATDVFGNPVASEAISVTLVGATFSDASITKTLTTSAVTSAAGVTPVTVLGSATGTLSAVTAGTVTILATDSSIAATSVGLPTAVKSAIATFSVSDLSGQVSALNAQIASLNAQLSAAIAATAKAKADAVTAADAATTALTLEKAAHVADTSKANKAYLALVAKYNAQAKKYKFAAIK
jgi:hypothetical protein